MQPPLPATCHLGAIYPNLGVISAWVCVMHLATGHHLSCHETIKTAVTHLHKISHICHKAKKIRKRIMVQHVFHCDNYFHSYGNFNVFDNDNANVGNPCLKICCTESNLVLGYQH